MAETPDKDQKTEAPSEKRKADALKKGDVLQLRELGTAFAMAGGAAWLLFAGGWMFGALRDLMAQGLRLDPARVRDFDPLPVLAGLGSAIVWPLAALFGLTMMLALVAPAMAGSIGLRGNALAPKYSRVDPLAGLKRMFGTHGLVELGKAVAKVLLLGGVGWLFISGTIPILGALASTDIEAATALMGHKIAMAFVWLAGGLFLIALIDAPVQFFRRQGRLKMTKQEVKDEHRQTEGAPELKQHQRQRQQQILMGSARKAVSEATVLLTNPTHFAVALRYRPGKDAAPVVVARGRGDTALAIRELAREQGLATLEYPQLTRAIYFSSRAGQAIAEDLFVAVATILAFVFNLDRAVAEGRMQPEVAVPESKRFDANGRR